MTGPVKKMRASPSDRRALQAPCCLQEFRLRPQLVCLGFAEHQVCCLVVFQLAFRKKTTGL